MRFVFFITLLTGCANSPVNSEEPVQFAPSELPQNEETQESQRPSFVVISKNTPIFLAPSTDAPKILFRSQEDQFQLEAKWQREIQDWASKTQTKFAREMEAEKKRLKKIKSPDARQEYVDKRRESRASRYIKDIDRRAKRIDESPQSRFIVLQKVRENGEWIEILTLNQEEESHFCYANGLPGLRATKLKGWVRKEALQQVTTQKQRYPIWRGSEVKLAAGVVLEEQQKDFIAHVDGFRIRLKIDPQNVAREFTAGSLFEAPFTASVFSNIALSEGHLKLSDDQMLPYNPFADLYVTETLWVDSNFFATTQTPCGEFTVHAEESLLVPAGKRQAMRLDGGTIDAAPPYARRGTILYNSSGNELATASFDVGLGTPIEINANGHQCFDKLVWMPPKKKKVPEDWKVTWCVSPDDIQN